MTLDDLIDAAEWRATTYIAPHQYVLQARHPALFDAFATLLASEAAYVRRFQGRPYRYVDVGGFRYWQMEDVLNRADNAAHPLEEG